MPAFGYGSFCDARIAGFINKPLGSGGAGNIYKFSLVASLMIAGHPAGAFRSLGTFFDYVEEGRLLVSRTNRQLFTEFQKRFAVGGDLLEIGSGNGYLRRNWPNFNGCWTELEQEITSLQDSRQRDPSGVFVHGDARHIDFPDSSFDVVCGYNSLDQFEELDVVVREMHRVLKSGGLFFHMIDQHQADAPAKVEVRRQGMDFVSLFYPFEQQSSKSKWGINHLYYGPRELVKPIREDISALSMDLPLGEAVWHFPGSVAPVYFKKVSSLSDNVRVPLSPDNAFAQFIPGELMNRITSELTSDDGHSLFSQALDRSVQSVFGTDAETKAFGAYGFYLANETQRKYPTSAFLSAYAGYLHPPLALSLSFLPLAKMSRIPYVGKYLPKVVMELSTIFYVAARKN